MTFCHKSSVEREIIGSSIVTQVPTRVPIFFWGVVPINDMEDKICRRWARHVSERHPQIKKILFCMWSIRMYTLVHNFWLHLVCTIFLLTVIISVMCIWGWWVAIVTPRWQQRKMFQIVGILSSAIFCIVNSDLYMCQELGLVCLSLMTSKVQIEIDFS